MADEKLVADLNAWIAEEEAKKEKAEEMIARLKSLLAALQRVPSQVVEAEESKTNFAMVAEFLRSKGNRPQSAKAIMEATGVAWGTLGQLLYRSHKDRFVASNPEGYVRKKLWALAEQPVQQVQPDGERPANVQETLFGTIGDFVGLNSADCCIRILRERNNEPQNVLTMAREALRRGYSGGTSGSPDDVLMTTAKSVWAMLGRDKRFVRVRSQVFRLVEPLAAGAPLKPPGATDGG